ncbi:MAG: hypothetical protein MR303_07455 [Emergencia sp.]|nr:hypothetical protein [Emergencia sp.]
MMKRFSKTKKSAPFLHRLDNCIPAGLSAKNELFWYFAGVCCCLVYQFFRFCVCFSTEKSALFTEERPHRLLAGAVMENFPELCEDCLTGFLILAFIAIPWSIYHYNYHSKESMSIYLMKRLPQRHELLKRCICLPLLSIVFTAAAAFAATLLLFGIYHIAIPDAALNKGQWQLLCENWRTLL